MLKQWDLGSNPNCQTGTIKDQMAGAPIRSMTPRPDDDSDLESSETQDRARTRTIWQCQVYAWGAREARSRQTLESAQQSTATDDVVVPREITLTGNCTRKRGLLLSRFGGVGVRGDYLRRILEARLPTDVLGEAVGRNESLPPQKTSAVTECKDVLIVNGWYGASNTGHQSARQVSRAVRCGAVQEEARQGRARQGQRGG